MSNNYLKELSDILQQEKTKEINDLYESILETVDNGNNIFICGNGGSAANANHIANDLLCVASIKLKKNIKVESLSANQAVITCIANDRGYENIYSEQVQIKGNENDLLILLSGSGNSKNIIKAIEVAKNKKLKTLSILGFDGGKCKKISDKVLHFQINDMQIAEDLQMIIFNACLKKFINSNS